MTTKALESPQVQRARRKIEKAISREREKITPESLLKKTVTIQHRLNRLSEERIDLKDGTIHHNAETNDSAVALHLLHKVHETATADQSEHSLLGRVTKDEEDS